MINIQLCYRKKNAQWPVIECGCPNVGKGFVCLFPDNQYLFFQENRLNGGPLFNSDKSRLDVYILGTYVKQKEGRRDRDFCFSLKLIREIVSR